MANKTYTIVLINITSQKSKKPTYEALPVNHPLRPYSLYKRAHNENRKCGSERKWTDKLGRATTLCFWVREPFSQYNVWPCITCCSGGITVQSFWCWYGQDTLGFVKSYRFTGFYRALYALYTRHIYVYTVIFVFINLVVWLKWTKNI